MGNLSLFPARVPIGKVKDKDGLEYEVLMTPEFARALTDLLIRVGGESSIGIAELEAMVSEALIDVPAAPLPDLEVAVQSELASVFAQLQVLQQRIEELGHLIAPTQDLLIEPNDLEALVMDFSTRSMTVDWTRPGKIGSGTPNTGAFTILNTGAGAVATPSFYLGTDTTTGFYRIGANNWGYSVAGVKKIDYTATRVTFSTELHNTGGFNLCNGLIFSAGTTAIQFKGASGGVNAEAFLENTDAALIIHASSSSGVAKTVDLCATGGASPQVQVAVAGAAVNGQFTVSGTFGVNGAAPQGPYGLPGAAVDPATTMALTNHIRQLLLNNGQG